MYKGSIHQVGRKIQNAPCNGWLAWYYIDETTGKREPINFLRQKIRRKLMLSGREDRNLVGDG
jgi:hypothetical protein